VNKPILSESGPAGVPDLPDAVRALDVLLNRRVLAASTEYELDASLRAKIAIKRQLVAVPDGRLGSTARELLGQMGGQI
jgi:hypothetical protein